MKNVFKSNWYVKRGSYSLPDELEPRFSLGGKGLEIRIYYTYSRKYVRTNLCNFCVITVTLYNWCFGTCVTQSHPYTHLHIIASREIQNDGCRREEVQYLYSSFFSRRDDRMLTSKRKRQQRRDKMRKRKAIRDSEKGNASEWTRKKGGNEESWSSQYSFQSFMNVDDI